MGKPRTVAVAIMLVMSGLAGAGGAARAAQGDDLVVDLGASTGRFEGGASGSLYGLSAPDVPTDNLVAGMGLATTDTKAQDGQQHPGSDALEVAKPFVDSGGRDLYIYMTDVYRNFPYERTDYAQYQGFLRTEVGQVLSSPLRDHIVLVPYNEPDGNWFGGLANNASVLGAFDDEWLQTYRLIKGMWPQARIAGPNWTRYIPGAFRTFLSFCKANDCLPDVVTWHYAIGVPSQVRPDVAAYRQLETSLGVPHLPIDLNEFAARYQLTNPGQMVGWLSAMEDSKVDADMSYWNINGALSDTAAQQNVPNAQWWLYHWYSSMTGDTVRVTPPQGDVPDSLQGVASLDTAQRQARIVVGGGPAGPANVVIRHVDPAIFGRDAHVTLEQDPWSGMSGPAGRPTRMLDADMPVGADGSVTVPVDRAGPPAETPGCTATGDRVAGKLGNALKLCGNGEFVGLPSGIAGGLHDFTVSAWVNPSNNAAWSRVFDFGTGTTDYMFLTLSAGGGPLRFAISTGGGGAEQRIDSSAGTLPTGTWSHVAVTLSGHTGTLYVNGKAVGVNDNMTLDPAALGTTTRNWIGRSQFADPNMAGMVDDFQIYDRALTGSEVGELADGRQGAGNVASYRFDEAGGATAADSSGDGRDATIVSSPAKPTSTSAYRITLAPGGTGSASPVDATWTHGYEAEDATITGSGATVNSEGSPNNLNGFATSGNQDVGGLRTGSDAALTFPVDAPATGDYRLSVVAGSFEHDADVSGPTNVYARVDGGEAQEVWLPVGFAAQDWNHGDTTVHLTKGEHRIELSAKGANGAATRGDALIDKIDLQLLDPRVQGSTVYEAEQANLAAGARADYRAQGQSGAGAATIGAGQTATFWVSAPRDGYADLAFRHAGAGAAGVTVNTGLQTLPVDGALAGGGSWATGTYRLYLSQGVNKVVVTGRGGSVTLDKLTVTPLADTPGAVTYQAEDGALTGTAKVADGFSQAHGGVVTGVGGGAGNALKLTVQAPGDGRYAMTVRFANDREMTANHFNPDIMTDPADISVNGGPTRHVNFGNTFHANQFQTLTIPVTLRRGGNTITFIANPQLNFDGKTVGVVFSGNDIGTPLRSDTAPNIDQITLAPFQTDPAGA